MSGYSRQLRGLCTVHIGLVNLIKFPFTAHRPPHTQLHTHSYHMGHAVNILKESSRSKVRILWAVKGGGTVGRGREGEGRWAATDKEHYKKLTFL